MRAKCPCRFLLCEGLAAILFIAGCGLVLCGCAGRAPEPTRDNGSATSETGDVTQYGHVEAAFLSDFAKFVTWPPQAFPTEDTPITIGILGDDPLEGHVEAIVKDKNVNGHPFRVLHLDSKRVAEARQCQILFVAPSEGKRLGETLNTLKGASTLTVSRMKGFIEAGGMINFFVAEKNIHFQINDGAARAAGLKLSAKLLSLARNPQN